MPTFSQRIGLKPIKKKIQLESVDNELRVGLWNCLQVYYWNQMGNQGRLDSVPKMKNLIIRLWIGHFKYAIDTLDYIWPNVIKSIRDSYFNKFQWNDIYEFIEFVVNNYPDNTSPKSHRNKEFMKTCNSILEEESAGYRFVDGLITPITSATEITEIEKTLQSPFTPVNTHLRRALELLSDRKSPDYRNSIKESISAVESMCKLITKDEKTTLGVALNQIESQNIVKLHPDLKEALKKLYHYTSDAEGIRHALLEESNLGSEDAQFMLVSCAAFVNYLIAKLGKAGISL